VNVGHITSLLLCRKLPPSTLLTHTHGPDILQAGRLHGLRTAHALARFMPALSTLGSDPVGPQGMEGLLQVSLLPVIQVRGGVYPAPISELHCNSNDQHGG
jgi:hypothetical protein